MSPMHVSHTVISDLNMLTKIDLTEPQSGL